MPAQLLNKPPDPHQGPAYRNYQNDRTYEQYPGRLIIPCADGPPVVIRTHQAYTQTRVTYSATKESTPPVLPHPRSDADLLDAVHVMPLPVPIQSASGSSFLYSATGYFTTLSPDIRDGQTLAYDYGTWPFRIEPIQTELELGGYHSLFNDIVDTIFPPKVDLTNINYVWPQALQAPPEFFSPLLS